MLLPATQADDVDDHEAPVPRHLHAVLLCAMHLCTLVAGALDSQGSLEGSQGGR